MKPYVRPELYYEDFELAQHIAGCSLTPVDSVAPETCSYNGKIGDWDGEGWFLNTNICTIETEDYCYTNSYSNIATINS